MLIVKVQWIKIFGLLTRQSLLTHCSRMRCNIFLPMEQNSDLTITNALQPSGFPRPCFRLTWVPDFIFPEPLFFDLNQFQLSFICIVLGKQAA